MTSQPSEIAETRPSLDMIVSFYITDPQLQREMIADITKWKYRLINQATLTARIDELESLIEAHETGAFYSKIINDRLSELKEGIKE